MHADSSLLFLLLFPRLPLKHTGSNCQQIFLEASAERRRNEERVCQDELSFSLFPLQFTFSFLNFQIRPCFRRIITRSFPTIVQIIYRIQSLHRGLNLFLRYLKKKRKGGTNLIPMAVYRRRIKASLMRSKKIASAISRLKVTCHLYPEG